MKKNMTDTLKKCCGTAPQIFTDTKIGHTIPKRVIACAICGKYSDDIDEKKAAWKWNNNFKNKNPVDNEFVAKLEKSKR